MRRIDYRAVRWHRAVIKSGIAYFGIVFCAGFVLGSVRVLEVAPRIGALFAVLLETPVILGVSCIACRACTRWFRVPRRLSARACMGGIAFALLMCAEIGLATFLFRQPAMAYLASFASPAGALGLAGQIAFAMLPVLQMLQPRG
jgi:hypothetical protein